MEHSWIKVIYTLSEQIIADSLTKALQGPKFKGFIQQIGLVKIKERLAEHAEAVNRLASGDSNDSNNENTENTENSVAAAAL